MFVSSVLSAGCILQILLTFVVSWVIAQHIQSRSTEMGLGRSIVMEHHVVRLSGTVRIGEMDQPVAPTIRIVDREWTYVPGKAMKILEDEALGGTHDVRGAYLRARGLA